MSYAKVSPNDPDEYELEPKSKNADEKTENGNVALGEDKGKMGEVELGGEEGQEKKLPYPKQVFFIFGNEICERFSYYGMRTILSLYFRDILGFSESDSTVIYHVFNVMAYFFPVLGAILSDSWLGKFRTILYVSMIYACGNILLALTSAEPLGIPQVPFSMIALLLVAMGTGGIKPCVSAFGGDQFVLPQQEPQLVAFFSVFYFSINAGSLISTFLTPVLREDVHCFDRDSCFPLAFAVPGALMIVSIVIFLIGMPLYTIRKPEGNIVVQVVKCIWHGARNSRKSTEKKPHWLDHAEDRFDRALIEDVKVALKVLVVFIPLPIFWACYDQQGSGWTFQATRMYGNVGGWTILPDQMQVINPLLILAFIPLFTYGVYPLLEKVNMLTTPLQRMVCGGLLTALAFGISAGLSAALEATYPTLPEEGMCQLRVYNPYQDTMTLNVGNLLKDDALGKMGYKYHNLKCSGSTEFDYTVELDASIANKTGKVRLAEETGYVMIPTDLGFLVFEDDIDKPEDGLPRIRTLLSNPSNDYNITYYDDDNEEALTFVSSNTTLFSLDPGTYKLGKQSFEFELGGVYTVLATLTSDGATVETATMFEITEPNSIHIFLQIPQYIIITAGEILFSITGLEFAYSQAPVSMKAVMTAAFLLTDAFGNLIIVLIESVKMFDKKSLDFTLYTCLMVADMVLFAWMATKYEYIKKEDGDENDNDKVEKKSDDETVKF